MGLEFSEQQVFNSNNMNSFEGSDNIINIFDERFHNRPRYPRAKGALGHRAVVPIYDGLAKVTPLPTATSERVTVMDTALEQLVELGTVMGIVEELLRTSRQDEATEIKMACHELIALGYETPAIHDFIIEYTETIDVELSQKARLAIQINEDRSKIIDIEAFIPEHTSA